MSLAGRSLISLKNWSLQEVQHLISLGTNFKLNKNANIDRSSGKVVSMAFFEPSTRTKVSFQVAIGRLGLHFAELGSVNDSSMVKGESFSETLKTIEAMGPDVMVLRANTGNGEIEAIRDYSLPIINAGCGSIGHPTQALTDALTIKEKFQLKNLKILFVGDINHSRVVKSNIELLKKFPGMEFGFCGPSDFLPESGAYSNSVNFNELEEALKWCDICMGLRVQKERHEKSTFSIENYQSNYRLTQEKINTHLSKDAYIMHPGPHVPDMDFEPLIFNDSRCLVRDQVTNGVYMRMALISSVLGLV